MTIIKALIDGVWHGEIEDTPDLRVAFARHQGRFRRWITPDGGSGFPAEAGRYRLYAWDAATCTTSILPP